MGVDLTLNITGIIAIAGVVVALIRAGFSIASTLTMVTKLSEKMETMQTQMSDISLKLTRIADHVEIDVK